MTKFALSGVATALTALVLPVQTMAQDTQQQAQIDEEKVERVTVTGSRLQRTEAESAAPIQVFTAEDLENSGVNSLEVILQRMSASAGAAGGQSNAYWTSNGWGTAQVNLRGLGINRTLVLLNGRRVVNGGTGANSSVDLNMIPVEMIERIEVLKDGASAIYGADAVAGVVNIITRKSYEGFSIEHVLAQRIVAMLKNELSTRYLAQVMTELELLVPSDIDQAMLITCKIKQVAH